MYAGGIHCENRHSLGEERCFARSERKYQSKSVIAVSFLETRNHPKNLDFFFFFETVSYYVSWADLDLLSRSG